MNKKSILLIFTIFLFCHEITFGQSIVNVSPLTGAANVVIPIYTVSNGQVSVPVSISYSGSGIKPKDVEGGAGIGWQLNAGGQISRQVKGIPDDCSKDNSNAAMLGWMIPGNAGADYARTYAIKNDGTNCNNDLLDISNLNSNVPYNDDTEPDMFYVDAPGLSCELVFDRSTNKFRPVSYQDISISYTTAGGTGINQNNITSFTILNDKGVKYVFSAPESVTAITFPSTATGTPPVNYFPVKYNRYKNGITYSDKWSLTSISDANGNGIILSYSPARTRYSSDPIELFISGATIQTVEYFVSQGVTPQTLNSISTTNINNVNNVNLNFTWNSTDNIVATGQTVVTSITGMGRQFNFIYSAATLPDATLANYYSRAFLVNFTDAGCGTPVNYKFDYIGLSGGGITLPDSTSTQLDYWGYYSSAASTTSLLPSVNVNPSNASYPRYALAVAASPGASYQYNLSSGSSRAVTAADVADGSLNLITYANGGTSSIVYEPNDYFDVPSATVVKGGGVRVKQITDWDNVSTANNIIRNYSYLTPSGVANAGLSSGVPVSLPQYAFTIPYSGTATGQALWTSATALSAYDLSDEDHTIMYAYSAMSQTGAGSTLYNFYVPAVYWNTNSAPICSGCTTAEWQPTKNLVSQYSCSANNGPIANLSYSYPFIPNPNYDFERGIPIKSISYNDAGTPVSETDYTYTRSYSPSVITAFKSDDYVNGAVNVAKLYNQYKIFYNTSELTANQTNKIYDASGAGQFRTTSVSYTYNSLYHKLMTKQTVLNSDNSVTTTNYTYTKDYPAAAGSDPDVNALYYLQQQNINVPVETYQQVTRGGTTLTTAASLTKFKGYTFSGFPTLYLPTQQLKWSQPSGAAFTPFGINATAQTVTQDGKYFAAANYDVYDNTGYLRTADDANKKIQTVVNDYKNNQTVAAFKNANYNEIAFNDFDSKFTPGLNTFNPPNPSFITSDGHTGNGYSLLNGQTMGSSAITKNTTAKNYIFAIWINSSGASGALNFSGGLSGIPAINYSSVGYKYYEIKIPATALASTFTLNFSPTADIDIDDIMIYPDVAEASTKAYDPVTHYKIAETNTNGVSAYYTNDTWGRMLYAYDQDKNIVASRTYVSAGDVNHFSTPVMSANTGSAVYHGLETAFDNVAPDNCFTSGVTYTWNYGDGSAPYVTTLPGTVYHTYAANGSYTVSETISSPLLGSKTGTLNITVVNLPGTHIHYSNTCTSGTGPPSYIERIDFIQGTTTVYSFTTDQLIQLPPPGGAKGINTGIYTIKITPLGRKYSTSWIYGYGSVTVNGVAGNPFQCLPYTGSAFTLTNVDLTTTKDIYFTIQPQSCTP